MHWINCIRTLGQFFLLYSLNFPSSHAYTSSINSLHATSQLPFEIPPHQFRGNSGRSWYSRTRNALIQTIWGFPSHNPQSNTNGKDSTVASPPPTLLAQYGGDLVLRFDIKSSQEAEALAEAVNVLFLDVWEFTSEWVDIRLSKDVVSVQQ